MTDARERGEGLGSAAIATVCSSADHPVTNSLPEHKVPEYAGSPP